MVKITIERNYQKDYVVIVRDDYYCNAIIRAESFKERCVAASMRRLWKKEYAMKHNLATKDNKNE
jgi:hypothetical protein